MKKWDVQEIIYPSRHFEDDGDQFFRRLWKQIDESQQYCWILTYAMDSSLAANITFNKLINAQKRGVDVVLFVDNLQQYNNQELVQVHIIKTKKKLKDNGGVYVTLNLTWREWWKIFNQEFFRRHHEKLVIIDDKAIIGSSNLESNYGSIKYGNSQFYDINMFTSGYINTFNFKEHFIRIANQYKIRLNPKFVQQKPLSHLPPNYDFIYTHQPYFHQLQQYILNYIKNAKNHILIVQPYYYKLKQFDKELKNALERGVKVDFLTSQKRDQPVYHYLKNYMLFGHLFHQNLNIYEYPEQLLHMKGYIIDGQNHSIGSFNNDRWSWKMNNEANIVSKDDYDIEALQRVFDRCKDYSTEIFKDGQVTVWRYTKIKFWQLFIYLSEVMMSKNKIVHASKQDFIPGYDDSIGF